MPQWMIVSSLDGKAPDVALYEEYAAPDTRLFSSEAYAREVLPYLIKHMVRQQWDSGYPVYRIVLVN